MEYLKGLWSKKIFNMYLIVGCIYLLFVFGLFANIAIESDNGFGIFSVVVFIVIFIPHALFAYQSGLKRGREEGRQDQVTVPVE